MSSELPVPRVVPGDVDVLERRARTLAAGVEGDGAAAGEARPVVCFRVRGRACAVYASHVDRAVVIAAPFAVPLSGGAERAAAFVDERPIPVVDLAGALAGTPRRAPELGGTPALVLATSVGAVAVVVEGPLDIVEDHLAERAEADDAAEAPLRVAGRLAGGAALVDAAWLQAWAGKAVRP